MTQEFYGTDLAKYKLERAREELDTAELLFENEKLRMSAWLVARRNERNSKLTR